MLVARVSFGVEQVEVGDYRPLHWRPDGECSFGEGNSRLGGLTTLGFYFGIPSRQAPEFEVEETVISYC